MRPSRSEARRLAPNPVRSSALRLLPIRRRAQGGARAVAPLLVGCLALAVLVAAAWVASAQGAVGYPPITVDQVVNHGLDPYDALYGED